MSHLTAMVAFVLGTCAVSDTVEPWPASASAQGRLCDAGDGGWGWIVEWMMLLSAVLAVVFVVLLWRRGGASRLLSPVPLVAMPTLVLVLLSLPPDTCSDATAAEQPGACTTTEG